MIWPKYDKNQTGSLSYYECRPFFTDIVAPLVNKKVSNGKTEKYTDEECQNMFRELDADNSKLVDKQELADFIIKQIMNKNKNGVKCTYFNKLKELKKYTLMKFELTSESISAIYGLDNPNVAPLIESVEKRKEEAARKEFNKMEKDIMLK